MKSLLKIFIIIVTLFGCDYADCAQKSEYEMTYEHVGRTMFRYENNEVVCYTSGHGLWCYKKENTDTKSEFTTTY
ncbi:MAG: hypothetical protein IJ880_11720 [Bacilli bacterium]|nr:hypothetical protein [Bacilli bacterium]